jgi:hypothetical protein
MKTIDTASAQPKKTWITPCVEIISNNYIEGGTNIGDVEGHFAPKTHFPGSPSTTTGGTMS